MNAQVVKWGNGQGIRIPKNVLLSLGIATGDQVSMTVQRDKLIIEKLIRHKSLEERAAESGGKLVSSEEPVDWGDPVGREVW